MLHLLIDRYCKFISVLMVAALAVMVVMVFGNVVLRYAFNSGIAVSEELSRWLFVWVIFLGGTVAVREHGHISTDMLVEKLPAPARKVCQVLGHVLMLWVTWLMFWGSLAQTRINLDVEAPVTGLSMAWLYGAGLLFAIFTGFFLLLELWEILSNKAQRSAA
ncbi:MAG: C4-dicarboxylate ABC transporter permease [Betaproteobacteria bacterium HGW-Betaproteobacteria-18]|nr:MAG: C4-dicarboxylate ABC transporter permease [Betaproteobacteria bacterium HGW-Betaproteobacteria-18]